MKEKSAILAVYDGDLKNVVIPAGTRMIKGEEIAFGLNLKRMMKESGIGGSGHPSQETIPLRPLPWMTV